MADAMIAPGLGRPRAPAEGDNGRPYGSGTDARPRPHRPSRPPARVVPGARRGSRPARPRLSAALRQVVGAPEPRARGTAPRDHAGASAARTGGGRTLVPALPRDGRRGLGGVGGAPAGGALAAPGRPPRGARGLRRPPDAGAGG